MTANAIALLSSLGLLALCLFAFYLWRDYSLDVFRERVFSLRDELFLYVLANRIDFANVAYSGLRDRMNTVLRFAHEFTFTRFVLAAFFRPFGEQNLELVAWEKAVDQLPEEDMRRRLREFRDAFAFAMLDYIMLRSFLRFLLLRPTKALAQAWKRALLAKATPAIEQLESDALEEDTNCRRREDPITVGAH